MKKLIILMLIIPLVSALEISEILPDPDDETEFVEIYNPSNKIINLESYLLKDKSNSTKYFTEISGGSAIKPNDYLILKTKSFLNNDFEIIRLYDNTTLINQVSYDYSKKGLSFSKINNEWILTKPTPGKENKQKQIKLESELTIESISKENISFGDLIQIKLKIYRADTSKKEIKISLEKNNEKVSPVISALVNNKYEPITLEIPFQIPINCKNNSEEGNYTLAINGLDTEIAYDLEIKGQNPENCVKETITKEKEVIKYKECTTETILNSKSNSTSEVVYESKQEKSKRYALFMFSGLLILLLIKKWNKKS
ncbi:MAG: lamin tail domain-containing protein [Candidatus Nanoarchaeia archaeon]|nr:lamin tail domain-containing protein [Candidatus Nanoarchaeia archaeon]